MHKKRADKYELDDIIENGYYEYNITKKISKKKKSNKNFYLSEPRNTNQRKYLQYINDNSIKLIIATGPAGTGKTMFPCEIAIQKFMNNDIDKIIITRPVVTADEDIGFLPGDMEDKMEPYMRPLYDIFYKFMHPNNLINYIKEKKIEIVPLAFMRGRTFKNCWIIADEMQNATCEQTMMLLTRIGENSKLILTGDPQQHDRKEKESGLTDFKKKLINYKGNSIKTVEFIRNDIQREPIVKEILDLYNL